MKSSFCIDLQRFMLIPTKFPLTPYNFNTKLRHNKNTGILTHLQLFGAN